MQGKEEKKTPTNSYRGNTQSAVSVHSQTLKLDFEDLGRRQKNIYKTRRVREPLL